MLTPDGYLTRSQAASVLGLSVEAVRNRARRGELQEISILDASGKCPRYFYLAQHVQAAVGDWKSAPRKVADYAYQPAEADCIYLAALLDGEGSVTISVRTDGKKRIISMTPRLSVCNTHRGVMEWLARTFGGKLSAKKGRAHYREIWVWNTTQYETLHILRLIVPFMKIKPVQAALLIEFQEGVIARNANSYHPLTEAEIEARLAVKNLISDLNWGRHNR